MLPRKISWLLLPLLSCMCCANPCQPIHCWKQISLQLAHANASNYDGMINQSGLFLRNQLNSSRLSVWWKQRPMLLQQIWHLVITRWIVFHVPLEQEWIALRSLWWECDAEIRKQYQRRLTAPARNKILRDHRQQVGRLHPPDSVTCGAPGT